MADDPIDVLPGEPIEAVWGNQIRDQSISTWADATARDNGIVLPDAGKVTWLDNPGVLEAFDGVEWVTLDQVIGGSGPFLPLAGGLITGTGGRVEFGTQVSGDGVSGGGVGAWFSSGQIVVWAGDRAGGNPSALPRLAIIPGAGAPQLSIDGATTAVRTEAPLRAGNGTEALPGLTLQDPLVGFYRESSNFLGLSIAGARRLDFRNPTNYATTDGSSSPNARNILVGTAIPDNGWGKDGDIYIRYQ